MLEGCCAFWQILQHAAGPSLQPPLSEDEGNSFVNHSCGGDLCWMNFITNFQYKWQCRRDLEEKSGRKSGHSVYYYYFYFSIILFYLVFALFDFFFIYHWIAVFPSAYDSSAVLSSECPQWGINKVLSYLTDIKYLYVLLKRWCWSRYKSESGVQHNWDVDIPLFLSFLCFFVLVYTI